ncbi:TcaA second domain-containing protein [Alkalicoccobacillus murimartini]|uniref:Membrane protein YvbJ n=1 Tax=Alkalicoccobacillus murimartini TaxID=171685 RepID=A0ABT9YGE9_9BACI|nr:hypothetical protein [Alkalicoccobacillus murimartini]MDQ0206943.1 putative membrane protein YvbJ [Alkalicoccobacillus murimartini]
MMQVCPKCQHKNRNQAFCSKCGTKLPEQEQVNATMKPFSKKTKIIVGASAGVIVIAGALFFTGKTLADKDRVLDSFLEAVADRDHNAVKSHLASSDPDLKVEDTHVDAFFEYLDEDPDAHSALIYKWSAESEVVDSPREVVDYSDYYMDFPITFTNSGSKWLVFDNYQFVLEALPLYVSTNMEEIEFTVDDTDVSPIWANEEFFFGYYLPGHYQIKGTVENDFGINEKELNVNLFEGDYYYSLGFDLNTAFLSVEPMIEGTKLILEDTNNEIDVTSSPFEFGPVLTDGTLTYHIEAESPFGLLKSVSSPIYETIDGYFAPNDEVKEQLSNTINEALLSVRTAKQEGNVDKLKHFGKEAYSDYKSSIESNLEWDYLYAGYLVETGFDWNETTIVEHGQTWKANVVVYEEWEEDTYYPGDTPSLQFTEWDREYELTFKDDAWTIIGSTYGYGEPTETFSFTKEDQDEVSSTDSAIEEGSKVKLSEDQADSLVYSFISSYVSGVNYGDPSYIDNYVTPEYKKGIESYMIDLYDREISQYFIDAETTSVSANDNGSYTIKTKEIYEIYYTDKADLQKTFNATYIVIYNEDEERWELSELVGDVKEIDSKEI